VAVPALDARLWVVNIDGGPTASRAFDHDGNAMPEDSLPAVSSVGRPLALGGDAVAWAVETFVSPRRGGCTPTTPAGAGTPRWTRRRR